MELEIARLTLGLITAVALPASIRALRDQELITLGFTALYAAYAIFPVLDGWPALALWALALLSRTSERLAGRSEIREPQGIRGHRGLTVEAGWLAAYVRSHLTTMLLLVMVALAFIAYHGDRAWDVVRTVSEDDRSSIILSGLLIAVFAGNILVTLAVKPYVGRLSTKDLAAFVPTGTYLGWVERCLVFVFITAGQPEAAALVVTVKSLARIPEVQRHQGTNFGQYVIVGTLTSLLVAVGTGIAVRLALGLPPL